MTPASPLTLPCGAVLPNRLAKSAMTEGVAVRPGWRYRLFFQPFEFI